jgi:hypothetical protein
MERIGREGQRSPHLRSTLCCPYPDAGSLFHIPEAQSALKDMAR